MNLNQLAKAFPFLAIGLLCVAVGCTETASSEYKAYSNSKLDSPAAGNKPTVEAKTIAADSNSTHQSDPDEQAENLSPSTSLPVEARKVKTSKVDIETPASDSQASDVATSKINTPREVKVLVKQRKFKTEGSENAIRVSYDDIDLLKVLNMEPVTVDAPSLMPEWLKALDRKRIRIRGFMYPAMLETGLTAFLLARDNEICCFGRDPKIYDVFLVRLSEGQTTDYIQNRPFDVEGVFHITPVLLDGELYRLYQMDNAIVVDK